MGRCLIALIIPKICELFLGLTVDSIGTCLPVSTFLTSTKLTRILVTLGASRFIGYSYECNSRPFSHWETVHGLPDSRALQNRDNLQCVKEVDQNG